MEEPVVCIASAAGRRRYQARRLPPPIHSLVCRVGFNENLVRKGLMFLQTTGDLEYRRERRLVHRMK